MSKFFAVEGAVAVVNPDGSFVHTNEAFLSLFGVMEHQLVNEYKLHDLCYQPKQLDKRPHGIAKGQLTDLPFTEVILRQISQSKLFSALLSIHPVVGTTLSVVTVHTYSKERESKRGIKSFRRYLESQLGLVAYHLCGEELMPLADLNTEVIQDNPALSFSLSHEILQFLRGENKPLKELAGLLGPYKLENCQNFMATTYAFQLWLPDDQDSDTDYRTETYYIVLLYPSPLQTFSSTDRMREVLVGATHMIQRPEEVDEGFLEELRQELIGLRSRITSPLLEEERRSQNLIVFRSKVSHTDRPRDVYDHLGRFCLENYQLSHFGLYRVVPDMTLTPLVKLGEEKECKEPNQFDPANLTPSLTKEVTYYSDKEVSAPVVWHGTQPTMVGFIHLVAEAKLSLTERELEVITNQVAEVMAGFELQTKLLSLPKLTNTLIHVKAVTELFEAVVSFVTQVFGTEFNLFAALLHNSENQTLEFVASHGYAVDFKHQTIALNSSGSVIAKCGRERRTINVSDVTKVDYYLQGTDGVRSELALPMLFNNQLIGVLNVESPLVNAFAEEVHVALMKAIRDITLGTYLRLSALTEDRHPLP